MLGCPPQENVKTVDETWWRRKMRRHGRKALVGKTKRLEDGGREGGGRRKEGGLDKRAGGIGHTA